MTLKRISPKDFQQHINKAEQQLFEQSPEMAKLLQKRGYNVEIIGYEVQNDLKVSAILFSTPVAGGLHMELHNGPICTDPNYLEAFYIALKEYAKNHKAIELKIKPYDTYQTFDSTGKAISDENINLIHLFEKLGYEHLGLESGYQSGNWFYLKNLTGITPDKLLNSFSKKGKPLVKKAKTFGIKVQKLTREQLPLFSQITSATSDRREFSDKPLEYYEFLYDSFNDKAEFLVATLNFQEYYDNLTKDQNKLKTKLDRLEKDLEVNPNSEKKQNQYREFSSQYQTFDVRKDEAKDFIEKYGHEDVPLCASLFVFLEKEAVYLYSGSYPEFNKFYAPAILQEYVMLKAIQLGIPTYNFLGISGNFDGSDGVLRFKQNFNGYIEQKPGVFMYYPKPLRRQ